MNKRSGIETKKKILNAAMKVFSTHGYAGAIIREIAKASGISIGGVYLYFKNKEDLYLSLIKERISEKNNRIERIVASGVSPTETLSALVEMHLDHAMKNRELILIHIKEHGFSFGSDIRKKYFQKQIDTIADIIREGIKKGEFRKCDVHETANLIMGAIRGLVLSMAIEDGKFIKAKGLNRLLLHGLSKNNNKQPMDIKPIKRAKR